MNRFATARALFEEFPTLSHATSLEPDDRDPIVFARGVAEAGKLREAVAICAYLLPKREAVWWTCHCLQSRTAPAMADPHGVELAESWARETSESARVNAADWARGADQQSPAAWAAYAAGFTSGFLAVTPDGPVRTPAHLTAESARVALVLAESRLQGEAAKAFLQASFAAALRYFEANEPAARGGR